MINALLENFITNVFLTKIGVFDEKRKDFFGKVWYYLVDFGNGKER
jgi:hypothetical protein